MLTSASTSSCEGSTHLRFTPRSVLSSGFLGGEEVREAGEISVPVAPLAGWESGALWTGTHRADCCASCSTVDAQGEGQRRAVVRAVEGRSIDDGKTWGRTEVGADRNAEVAVGGVEV